MILACKCSKGRAQGGKVLMAAEPRAKPGSSFTFFFEAFSALLIKGGKLVSGVGKYVGIHEKLVWTIIRNLTSNALSAQPFEDVECLRVDETGSKKRHRILLFLHM